MRKLAWMGLVAVMCTTGIVGSLFGAAPTVTVTAFNAGSGAYTLSVGARDAKTYVYAAAAVEDKGETTAGWEVVKKLGVCEVGTEAVTLEGVLPRNMTMTSMKVRFFAANFPGTRVEYLTSQRDKASGNATVGSYIDTGHVADKETEIELETCYEGNTCPFGVRGCFYFFGSKGQNDYTGFFEKTPSATVSTAGKRCVMRLGKAGAFVDGTKCVDSSEYDGASGSNLYGSLTLFARRQDKDSTGAGAIRKQGTNTIWWAVIKHNGETIRDYVPYKDANGVGFMYDRVEKTPCYNDETSGGYPFLVGSETDPDFGDATGFAASEAKTTVGVTVSATVKDLALTQVGSRRLKVTYTLENAADPVVVTARMLTNGVAVAGANLFGDIATEQTNGQHVCYWHSDDDIPNLATDGVKAELKLWHTNAPPAYLVFDVGASAKPRHYEAEADLPGGIGSDVYRTTRLVMRRVNARGVTFRMGSPVDEKVGSHLAHAAGQETRYVTFSEDFYMGVFEFTQGQMLVAATNGNPSAFKLATNNQNLGRPLENFTYNKFHSSYKRFEHPGHGVHDSSVIYQLRKTTGCVIDLPTEAQWEFACRAGTGTAFYWGSDGAASHSRNNANPSGNTTDNWNSKAATCSVDEGGTARVGSYEPNPWGFYDMSGNVWEMCVDSYKVDGNNKPEPFAQNTVDSPLVDPCVEETSNNLHVRRGGGWGAATYGSTSSVRSSCQDANNGVGFRLVCPVPYTKAWEK